MKKSRKLRAIITSVVVFVTVFASFVGCPFKTYANVSFELPERNFNVVVNEDGSAEVRETVTWLLKDPFRFVSWQVSYPEGVTLQNFQYKVLEGPNTNPVLNYGNITNGLYVELWFSNGNNPLSVPKDGQVVTVVFSYHLKDIVMECMDFSQLFIKYIGSDTTVKTNKLEVQVTFPKSYGKPIIYNHPLGLKSETRTSTTPEGGFVFNSVFRDVPPKTYVEGRFVFPGLQYIGTTYKNNSLSLADIESIEQNYTKAYMGAKTMGVVYPIVLLVLFFVIYTLFGRERKINYSAPYERDFPSEDMPEVVNAIVMRSCSKPDHNGFSAAILDMVKKGYLAFKEGEKDVPVLKVIKPDPQRPELSDALHLIDNDGIIDFGKLGDVFKDKNKASEFWNLFTLWQERTRKKAVERHYLSSTGNFIAKLVAIVGGLILPVIISFDSSEISYPLMDAQTVLFFGMGISAVMGIIVLFMKSEVFSHWSEEGLLYVRKWLALRRYLTDFTLLSKNPPQGIAIWDDYLVYGTSLGVAKKVIENIGMLYPTPPATPVVSAVYARPFLINNISSIPTSAEVAISKQNTSGIGGFGAGGGIGGGAGGSSVGAG